MKLCIGIQNIPDRQSKQDSIIIIIINIYTVIYSTECKILI